MTGSAPGSRRAVPGPGVSGLDEVLREHWWAAVAAVARRCGDLEIAEDAVQEACAAAVIAWPAAGPPPSPRGWLITTAWHKAVDLMRRDSLRASREAAAAADLAGLAPQARPGLRAPDGAETSDDELALIFTCCHPSLDPAVRVALTLRAVCGLSASEIAAAFVLPEATLAQRLVRAKRKIRQAGISLTVPGPDALAGRLSAVLRVIYLVFTEGHQATGGSPLIRADLCDQAVRLARALHGMLPGEPEVTGLLALLLLTDARRDARTGPDGALVLLADQDRSRWDLARIGEGEALVEAALRARRPGPYQLHAAIAACHSTAASAEGTDWAQIAALYARLAGFEPTPVVLANQAVAIAMSEGPQAGLAILDRLARDGRLDRWPQLHVARAELLRRLGRASAAEASYRRALQGDMSLAERYHLQTRLAEVTRR